MMCFTSILVILQQIKKLLNKIPFFDDATFPRHIVQIFGSENPQEIIEYKKDSPKSTFGVAQMNSHCNILFVEKTTTADTYLTHYKNVLSGLPAGRLSFGNSEHTE